MTTSLGDLQLDIFAPIDRLESDLDRASNLIAARAKAWDAQLRKELSIDVGAAEVDLAKSIDRLREATKEPLSIALTVGEGSEDLADLDGKLARIYDRAGQLADIRMGLTIDDAAANRFSKTLDLLEDRLDRTAQFFAQTPLVLKTDFAVAKREIAEGLAALQKQMKATPLMVSLTSQEAIVAEAQLSRSLREMQAMARKYPIKIGVEISTADINEQIANLNKQTIVTNVDDRQLTELNKHLSKKQAHLKEVISDFRSNPIVPTVDISQILAGRVQIDKLLERANTTAHISLTTNTENLEKAATRLEKASEQIHQHSNKPIHVKHSSSWFGTIKQGIGESIGQSIFKSTGVALNKNFGFDLSKTVEKLFDRVGKEVGDIWNDESVRSAVNTAKQKAATVAQKAQYIVGDAIATGIDYKKQGKTEDGRTIFRHGTNLEKASVAAQTAKVGLSSLFSETLAEARKSAPSKNELIPQLYGVFSRTGLFAAATGYVRQHREQTIRNVAIPEVEKRAEQIPLEVAAIEQKIALRQAELAELQKDPDRNATAIKSLKHYLKNLKRKSQNTGTSISSDDKSLIIATGGFTGGGGYDYPGAGFGVSGEFVAMRVRKENPKNARVIWTRNTESDTSPESPGVDTVASLLRPNIRGYNKDAVEMAAQALIALQKNPNIDIKLIGECGGGFVAQEATRILQEMGVRQVSYLGVGTPSMNCTLPTPNGRFVFSPDDPMAQAFTRPEDRAKTPFLDLPKNEILGVYQHSISAYQKAGAYPLRNFYGVPFPDSAEIRRIEGKTTAREKYLNRSYSNDLLYSKRSDRGINQQVLEIKRIREEKLEKLNLSTIRDLNEVLRKSETATGEEKEFLERLAKRLTAVHLRITGLAHPFSRAGSTLFAIEAELPSLEWKGPAEIKKFASTKATVLNTFEKEIGEWQVQKGFGTAGLIAGDYLDRIAAIRSEIDRYGGQIVPFQSRIDYKDPLDYWKDYQGPQLPFSDPWQETRAIVPFTATPNRSFPGFNPTYIQKARDAAIVGADVVGKGAVTGISALFSAVHAAEQKILGKYTGTVNAILAGLVASRLPGGQAAIGLLGDGIGALAHMPLSSFAGMSEVAIGEFVSNAIGGLPLLKGLVPQIAQAVHQALTSGAIGGSEAIGGLLAPVLAGAGLLRGGKDTLRALPGYDENANDKALQIGGSVGNAVLRLAGTAQRVLPGRPFLQLPAANWIDAEVVDPPRQLPGTVDRQRQLPGAVDRQRRRLQLPGARTTTLPNPGFFMPFRRDPLAIVEVVTDDLVPDRLFRRAMQALPPAVKQGGRGGDLTIFNSTSKIARTSETALGNIRGLNSISDDKRLAAKIAAEFQKQLEVLKQVQKRITKKDGAIDPKDLELAAGIITTMKVGVSEVALPTLDKMIEDYKSLQSSDPANIKAYKDAHYALSVTRGNISGYFNPAGRSTAVKSTKVGKIHAEISKAAANRGLPYYDEMMGSHGLNQPGESTSSIFGKAKERAVEIIRDRYRDMIRNAINAPKDGGYTSLEGLFPFLSSFFSRSEQPEPHSFSRKYRGLGYRLKSAIIGRRRGESPDGGFIDFSGIGSAFSGAQTTIRNAFNHIGTHLPNWTGRANATISGTGNTARAVIQTQGPSVVSAAEAAVQKIASSIDTPVKNILGVFSTIGKEFSAIGREILSILPGGNRLITVFRALRGIGFNLGATIGVGIGIAALATNFYNVQKAFDFAGQRKRAEFVTGTQAGGDRLIARSKAEAARLGIESSQSIDTDIDIAGATKGTPFEGEIANFISSSFKKGATVRGLNREQQGRGFAAVLQMLGKGGIYAEELRGQLAESGFSDAIPLLARSLGISTPQLMKLMDGGGSLGNDAVLKLAVQIETEATQGVKAPVSGNRALTQLGNATNDLQIKAGQLFENGTIGTLNAVTEGVKFLTANFDFLSKAVTASALVFGGRFVLQLAQSLGLIPQIVTLTGVIQKAGLALQALGNLTTWTSLAAGARSAALSIGRIAAPIAVAYAGMEAFASIVNTVKIATGDLSTESFGDSVKKTTANLADMQEALNRLKGRSVAPVKIEGVFKTGNVLENFFDGIVNIHRRLPLPQLPKSLKGGIFSLYPGLLGNAATFEERRAENAQVNLDELLSVSRTSRSTVNEILPQIDRRRIEEIDEELTLINLQRNNPYTRDSKVLQSLNEREGKLNVEKIEILRPLSNATAGIDTLISNVKEVLSGDELKALINNPQTRNTGLAQQQAAIGQLEDLQKVQALLGKAANQTTERLVELKNGFLQLNGVLGQALQTIERNSIARTINLNDTANPLNTGAIEAESARLQENKLRLENEARRSRANELLQDLSQPRNSIIANELLSSKNTDLDSITLEQIQELEDANKNNPETLEIVRRMALYVKLKDEFIRGEQSLSENLASQRRAGIQAELAMGDYHRSIRRQLEESASAFNLAKIQFNRTNLRSQLLSALNGGQNFVSQFVESVAGIFETLGSIPEIINRGSDRTRQIIQQSTDRQLEQQRTNEQNNRTQPVDTPTPPRPNDRGAIQNQPVTFLSGGRPITSYAQINTHHDGPAYQFATIGGRREAIRSDVTARERAQGVLGSGPRVAKDFVINRNGNPSIPIPSATAGRVVLTPEAASGGYGNLVTVVGDDDRILGRYAHLSQFLVGEGDRVVPGQGVGIQGSTGTSTGIHGHVELSADDWERYFTALRTGNFGGAAPPNVPQDRPPGSPIPVHISPDEFQRYIPSIANPNRGRRVPSSQQRRANPPPRSPATRARSVPLEDRAPTIPTDDRPRRPIPTIPPIPTVDRRLPIRRNYTGANGNLRFNRNFLTPQKEISAIPESAGIRAALAVISRGETLNYSERNSYFFRPGGGSISPPNSGWPSIRENIGRYGFNPTDYNDLRQFNPGIQGFDPVSQDLMAIAKLQMRGRGGRELKDLLANPTLVNFRRFREAASAEWESLRPNFMRIQGQTDESLFALFQEEVRRGATTPAGRSYTFADGNRRAPRSTRTETSNRPTNPTPLPQVPTARQLANSANSPLDRIDTQNIEANSLNTQSELRNALTTANREILNTDETFRQGRLTAGDNQRQTIQSLQDLFQRSAIPSIQTDLTQQLRETNRTFDEEDRKLDRQIFDLQRQIATARQTIQNVTPIIENPATDERERQTAEYTRNRLNGELPNIEKRLAELQNYRQQLPAERTRALANVSRLTRMADRSQQIARDRLLGEQVNGINQYGTQFLQQFTERNPTARIDPNNDPLYTRQQDNLRSARNDRAQSEFDLDRQFLERRFSSNPVANRELYQQALRQEEWKYRAREAAAARERRYGEADREINRRTAERQLNNESGQLNIDILGTRSRSIAAFSSFNPNLNFTPEGNSIDLQYQADTAGEKQRYENQREELLDRWERSELPEVQAQIRQQLESAYQQHQQTIGLLNRQLVNAKAEEQIRLRQYEFTRQSTFASSKLNILRAGIEVRRSMGDETNSGYLERDASVADLELAHRQQRDEISNKLSRGEINAAEASQLFSELERVKDLKLQAITSQFSDLGFVIRTARGEVNGMFTSFFEGKSAIESLGNAWTGLMRQLGNRFAGKLTDSLSEMIFGTGNHPTAQPGQQDFLRMFPIGQLRAFGVGNATPTPEVYGPPSPASGNFFGDIFKFLGGVFGFADGGIIPGGAFGGGGITKGSQLALIGEGRYNEAVVPLPDGRSIPVKMNEIGDKVGNTNVSITFNNNGSTEVNTDGAQAFAQMATSVFYNLVAKEKRPGGTLNQYR
jgi:tape measure domain-containing protein